MSNETGQVHLLLNWLDVKKYKTEVLFDIFGWFCYVFWHWTSLSIAWFQEHLLRPVFRPGLSPLYILFLSLVKGSVDLFLCLLLSSCVKLLRLVTYGIQTAHFVTCSVWNNLGLWATSAITGSELGRFLCGKCCLTKVLHHSNCVSYIILELQQMNLGKLALFFNYCVDILRICLVDMCHVG